MAKKKLYVIVSNHMDLLWRRCFERRFEDGGRTFVSYADLQGWYIDDNLALCEKHPGYKFQIECPAVLQAYLRRRPEQKALLQRMFREKRVWTGATGENIVDGNLSGGESIVRNFVMGQLYLRDTFGTMPRLANRDDAFGNGAQLPQILRGCGIRWVKGLSYTTSPADYWRGLDGSTVYTRLLPVGGMGGGWRKYAPCPTCYGTGQAESGAACPACAGRGIDRPKNEADRQPITLGADLPAHSAVMVGGEEILPDEGALRWMESLDPAMYEAAFAFEEDEYPLLAADIACDDPPPGRVHTGELNPNNTGCYVTRIKSKQCSREMEDTLLRLEALCTMAMQRGAPYPKAALDALWRDHFLTLFHDAVTATHIDAAAAELDDLRAGMAAREAALLEAACKALAVPGAPAGRYTLVNHSGLPHTGPCSVHVASGEREICAFASEIGRLPVLESRPLPDGDRSLTVFVGELPPFSGLNLAAEYGPAASPAAEIVEPRRPGGIQAGILRADERAGTAAGALGAGHQIENERYTLALAKGGVAEVWDKALNRVVAGGYGRLAFSLSLEGDIGSPWATVMPGRERLDLSPFTYLHRLERHPGFERAHYLVDLPQTLYGAINSIRLDYTLTLYAGAHQVDVQIDADWDTYNTRLLFRIHANLRGRHLYEIPYGVIERKSYEPIYRWTGVNGDWPAQNFAGVSADWSLAVLNRGLPAYHMANAEHGTDIEVSLLRSPTMPTYLHEPDAYSVLAFDGMRDTGRHCFHLAMAAYGQPLERSTAVADGRRFNSRPWAAKGRLDVPQLPALVSDCAYITCVKRTEQGNALVLRAVEYRGTGGRLALQIPSNTSRVEKTDMLEQAVESLPVDGNKVTLPVRPFEIITLKLTP